MRAILADLRLRQGRVEEAEALIDWVLPRLRGAFAVVPLCARGLIRARRGDGDAWAPLDEALKLADSIGSLDVLHPVAHARAEAAWIEGDDARAATEARRALPLAQKVGDPWLVGDLASWLRRAGAPLERPGTMPEPYALELAGRWRQAAAAWDALGFPYETALCQAEADEPAVARQALQALHRLGASATTARVLADLRKRGVRLPRGPSATSRADPFGLTAREREVVALLAAGASNRDIGRQLVISQATAARHVANILAKLGAATRAQAVGIVAERGLTGAGAEPQRTPRASV
jgi:DNA-binding CsgD family transcriptional regulator